MDALARLHPRAIGLLSQVDEVLTRYGAPAEHRIWSLLRGVGALPGDGVAAVAAWTPQAWAQRAESLRRAHRHGLANADLLHALSGWDGRAGEAFSARLAAVKHDSEALAEWTDAAAAHCERLHRWLAEGRKDLARTLAGVLSSAEAVSLVTGWAAPPAGGDLGAGWGGRDSVPTVRAGAAAEIGAILLSELERLLSTGESLPAGGAGRLIHPAATRKVAADVSSTATLRVEL